LHLLGAGGFVDRHGDRADGPDRVVDQRPLVPGLGHQPDPLARLDARRDQALRDVGHLPGELPGGHVGPGVADPPAEQHEVRWLAWCRRASVRFASSATVTMGGIENSRNEKTSLEIELPAGNGTVTPNLAHRRPELLKPSGFVEVAAVLFGACRSWI